LYGDHAKNEVTSASPHSPPTPVMLETCKFDMHNPNMDGSKVINQTFDILPRSQDI